MLADTGRRVAAAGLVLGSLGTPATLRAQEQPPRFADRVDVIEMFLDVSVTDKRGNQILGLEADDFRIELRGQQVEVTSSTFLSAQTPEALRIEAQKRGFEIPKQTEPTDRLFVLFFHDLVRSDFQTLGVTAQRAVATSLAREWVGQELLERDYVAVVSFDYKLKIQQDFTQSSALLDRALRRAMLRRDPERSERPLDPEADESTPSLLEHLPSGKVLRDRTPYVSDALVMLAEGLRPLRGRKNLVLFSIGLGMSRELALSLNRSNVDVYGMDISPPRLAAHTGATALNGLARDSGGRAYGWGRSYLESLRSVSRRTSGYYQLTVLASADTPPAPRLKVLVSDPSWRTVVRPRYLAPVTPDAQNGGAEGAAQ